MKKSLYQDASFAAYWNERAGTDGEAYKRYVLDPLMFGLVGAFKNKSVVELGCGNGYLAPKFLQEGVSNLVMMDISEHNLRYAAEKCTDSRVSFFGARCHKAMEAERRSIRCCQAPHIINTQSQPVRL